MVVVAWELGRASVRDWLTVLIFVVSIIAVFRFTINSAWLILGAAVVGWIVGG
jgi:chromate transporter